LTSNRDEGGETGKLGKSQYLNLSLGGGADSAEAVQCKYRKCNARRQFIRWMLSVERRYCRVATARDGQTASRRRFGSFGTVTGAQGPAEHNSVRQRFALQDGSLNRVVANTRDGCDRPDRSVALAARRKFQEVSRPGFLPWIFLDSSRSVKVIQTSPLWGMPPGDQCFLFEW